MNFLCHALPYLDRPLLAAATGVPDWLSVVDRKIRARGKVARSFLTSDDPAMREVAAGIVQHVEDDRWFHGTRAFAEISLQLAVELRELLPGDAGFRPSFVGHILVEMLLDALWIRDDRAHAVGYFDAVASVPARQIQDCVNIITGRPTDRLQPVIDRFVEVQFLYDYLDNATLLARLNQVMNRVGLSPLPPAVEDWLSRASILVESRRLELLTPPASLALGQSSTGQPFPFAAQSPSSTEKNNR